MPKDRSSQTFVFLSSVSSYHVVQIRARTNLIVTSTGNAETYCSSMLANILKSTKNSFSKPTIMRTAICQHYQKYVQSRLSSYHIRQVNPAEARLQSPHKTLQLSPLHINVSGMGTTRAEMGRQTQSLEEAIQNPIASWQLLYFLISNSKELKSSPINSIQDDNSRQQIPCVASWEEIRVDLAL